MFEQKEFAAFIMTFQRNHALEETIRIVLDQTFPPDKILIVDNDPAESARSVAQNLSHLPVSYHAVGYNSGPAGAAKRGLAILANEGYQWIGWIDDDDPPLFEDSFEVLIKRACSIKNCGGAGAVGQRFNLRKALILRVPDEELDQDSIIYVDNIAGGMCKLVNADVVRKCSILPDEDLFYGFEELDFDLRTQQAGYSLITDALLYKQNRVYHNRIGFKQKRGQKKPQEKLWREYYSARNLMIIAKKQRRFFVVFLLICRFVLKALIGFRLGLRYGIANLKYHSLAIFHFAINKSGKQI